MQENKKTIKLQKIGTIALLCLLVVAFVGSIFCAMILPFANISSKVANAYSASFEGVLQQASSEYTLRNIPTDVTQLCAVFFNLESFPDFSTWDLPLGETQLLRYTYTGDANNYIELKVNRVPPSNSGELFGVTTTSDVYMFTIEAFIGYADSMFMGLYCTEEDSALLAGVFEESLINPSFNRSYISAYGSGISNFTSFTVNSTYIDKLVPWVSLSSRFESAGGGTSDDDIKNAYNNGYSKGISDYLYNSGLVYPLNVDTYVSTGGFSVKNGAETHNILSAKSVENHTKNKYQQYLNYY